VSTPARSALFFVVAGLMEIGRGYLMWLWLRERWAWWVGALGALVLVGYGVVPALQPANFGRVYAAYGGVFIAMSMLWGWWVDAHRPERRDVVGGALRLAGVALIMYAPRSAAP
jgi:small multidrug resistance family-3 protein